MSEIFVIELQVCGDTEVRTFKGTETEACQYADYWVKQRGGPADHVEVSVHTLDCWIWLNIVPCSEIIGCFNE